MFSSSDEVYDVSISCNYILLSDRLVISGWENELKLKVTASRYDITGRLKNIHVRTVSQ